MQKKIVAAVLGTVLIAGMFFVRGLAWPPEVSGPFANATEQRIEMNKLLAEIRDLIKEQNRLLKSGECKITVVEEAEKTVGGKK